MRNGPPPAQTDVPQYARPFLPPPPPPRHVPVQQQTRNVEAKPESDSSWLWWVVIGLFCCSGCGPFIVEPDGKKPNNPDVKPIVETRWTLLADSIDNPDTLPKNSTQLSLMLTHLRSLGKITDQDVAACKACVPGIDATESLLTKTQSDAIRGLK